MSRQESDREDLMREATALVRRAELIYPGRDPADPLIAGFRRDGRLALYFGADPVYQFDAQQQLRRAYASGFLYRTQGETLARLTRHRTETETQLLRQDLTPTELEGFRQTAMEHLRPLADALSSQHIRIIQQVPEADDLYQDLEMAISEILVRKIPLAPSLPGKR